MLLLRSFIQMCLSMNQCCCAAPASEWILFVLEGATTQWESPTASLSSPSWSYNFRWWGHRRQYEGRNRTSQTTTNTFCVKDSLFLEKKIHLSNKQVQVTGLLFNIENVIWSPVLNLCAWSTSPTCISVFLRSPFIHNTFFILFFSSESTLFYFPSWTSLSEWWFTCWQTGRPSPKERRESQKHFSN